MFEVVWHEKFLNDLYSLDAKIAMQLKSKVDNYLAQAPKDLGKPLSSSYKGLYRYRYGDYRIIYEILSKEEVIAILKVGHRSDVY